MGKIGLLSGLMECNVWCIDNTEEHQNLGLPEGDRWMPIVIDFNEIIVIKLAGENDFLGSDKACVYLRNGANFTIDVTFNEAVSILKSLRNA